MSLIWNSLERRLALALVLAGVLGPGPGVADPLSTALTRLQSEDVLVADQAVEEIVALGPPAVDALLPLLADARRDVRAGAIRGLGRLGDARAAAPLRTLLRESLDLPTADTMTDRYLRILLLQALGRLADREAEPLFRSAFEGSDPFERVHAAISLFLSGADPGYDAVVECLGDPDPAIRTAAAAGLGESEQDAARELLLTATTDDSWLVRDAAFRSLARHGDTPAVQEAYREGAADPSWYVRETVAEFAPE